MPKRIQSRVIACVTLLFLLTLTTFHSIFAARVVDLLPITPSPNVATTKIASRTLNQTIAARQVRRCLSVICDTGASDAAISQTRGLATRLRTLAQLSPRRLADALTEVLSYQTGDLSRISTRLPTNVIPGISSDLLDRAASACYARGRRKPGEIVLSFAGDCTFGTVNGDGGPNRFPSVYRRSDRFDYPFALVRPWFLDDDLTIVNFECTLTGAVKTADKKWKFKGSARYASIFPASSIEAVGLSNNHSFDYLQAGFNDTVANFRKAHVPAFYQNTPYITTLQGIQTVIIGDCTVVGENTTRIDGVPGRVIDEIKRYKKPNNIVIVVMHWGSELDSTPRSWQQALGRRFIDAGADAVVGHHPHVVQGLELYKGKYIAYSLGNFAFGGNSLARNPDTFILRLRFHLVGGKTFGMTPSIVPCWITSSRNRNTAGVLKNDYQPKPIFGAAADRTVALVLDRSSALRYGVKMIGYLRLH